MKIKYFYFKILWIRCIGLFFYWLFYNWENMYFYEIWNFCIYCILGEVLFGYGWKRVIESKYYFECFCLNVDYLNKGKKILFGNVVL